MPFPAVTAFCHEVFDAPVEATEVAPHLVANPTGVDVEAGNIEECVYPRFQVYGEAIGVFERFVLFFGFGASTGYVCSMGS